MTVFYYRIWQICHNLSTVYRERGVGDVGKVQTSEQKLLYGKVWFSLKYELPVNAFQIFNSCFNGHLLHQLKFLKFWFCRLICIHGVKFSWFEKNMHVHGDLVLWCKNCNSVHEWLWFVDVPYHKISKNLTPMKVNNFTVSELFVLKQWIWF